MSRQASQAGECCSAPFLCAGISPLCPPHPCGCALLRGSKASPNPGSTPVSAIEGAPSVWKLFLLHSFLPEVQVHPYSFVSASFFLLPCPGTWGVSCVLGSLRSSASVQYVFCRSYSTCRCISDVFVGRKVISTSYCSAVLKVSQVGIFKRSLSSSSDSVMQLVNHTLPSTN